MSFVPHTLKYYLKEMKGVSLNFFKVYPTSNIVAKMGGQISVLLPQNTIIDLDTFALYATLTLSAGCAPPKNVESLIYSIQVTINGQVIQNPCMNTNLLYNTLSDLMWCGKENTLRNVVALGAAQIAVPATNTTQYGPVPIVISNFLGFLSSAAPRKLDTSILGDVRVILTLAGPEVLVASTTAPATITWELDNLYFGVQCLSLDDGVYYSAVNSKLKEGPIEIPFRYYTNFVGPNGGSTTLRSTLASESINLAIGTCQGTGHITPANALDATINSAWFQRDGSTISDSVMQVNNVFMPSYPALGYAAAAPGNQGEIFQQTCDNLDITHQPFGQPDGDLNSLVNFYTHYFAHIVKFSCDGDEDRPLKSGLSTIGNSASINWKITVNGNTTTVIPHLFIEATGVVEVHSGRQLNLKW